MQYIVMVIEISSSNHIVALHVV